MPTGGRVFSFVSSKLLLKKFTFLSKVAAVDTFDFRSKCTKRMFSGFYELNLNNRIFKTSGQNIEIIEILDY